MKITIEGTKEDLVDILENLNKHKVGTLDPTRVNQPLPLNPLLDQRNAPPWETWKVTCSNQRILQDA